MFIKFKLRKCNGKHVVYCKMIHDKLQQALLKQHKKSRLLKAAF